MISLPEELLIDILKWLPAKCLLRFRCVSKFWSSLISSSHFIKIHKNHSHSLGNYNVILQNGADPEYTLHRDNGNLDEVPGFDFPFSSFKHFSDIVGCVNGVVCMCHKARNPSGAYRTDIVLWNPSIRKYSILPISVAALDFYGSSIHFGFGYDDLEDDYKAVQITERFHPNACISIVDIFNLSQGSWRCINSSPPCCIDGCSHATVNGNAHWKGRTNPVIVAFDFTVEAFREIMCPMVCKHGHWPCDTITVCNGLLSLLVGDYKSTKVDVWVMKQYGVTETWTKFFSFDLIDKSGGIVGLGHRGQVFFEGDDGMLVSYCPQTAEYRHLAIHINNYYCQSYTCLESLVLLNEAVCSHPLLKDLDVHHRSSRKRRHSTSSRRTSEGKSHQMTTRRDQRNLHS